MTSRFVCRKSNFENRRKGNENNKNGIHLLCHVILVHGLLLRLADIASEVAIALFCLLLLFSNVFLSRVRGVGAHPPGGSGLAVVRVYG